jgi:glycosyltransferase involved in cell wall biosynthesis
MRNYKIAGLTRVRNESLIIKEHLDAMAEYCTGGIYVFDDCSTDNTVEICKAHPAVKSVIGVKTWDDKTELAIVEKQQRQALIDEAKKDSPDWFVYLDADERLFYNFCNLAEEYDVVVSELLDFYITEEDKDREYTGNIVSMRKFCGPESRAIVSIFRNSPFIKFTRKCSRNPEISPSSKILYSGYIRHYGKAISVKDWERRCDFYINRAPEYKDIWIKRKGKAVHSESDFFRPLRTWKEVHKYSRQLVSEDYTEQQLTSMINYY